MTQIQDNQARQWGMLCHLTALCVFVGVPFGNILGPLIIWVLKREMHPFIDDQGRESVNFQISMIIYTFMAGILVIVGIGILLLIALAVFEVVVVIVAAVRASEGVSYRYPVTIRFLK